MQDKYTSLELSKKLSEAGCKLESEWVWVESTIHTTQHQNIPNNYLCQCPSHIGNYAKSYDILNDICCKYVNEFFGSSGHERINEPYDDYSIHTNIILYLMQQNRKQEAEDYIWENCLFNPKNNINKLKELSNRKGMLPTLQKRTR